MTRGTPPLIRTARLTYYRWYLNTPGFVRDHWTVDVSNDGGSTWVNAETIDDGHRAAAGVYFARLDVAGGAHAAKLILTPQGGLRFATL